MKTFSPKIYIQSLAVCLAWAISSSKSHGILMSSLTNYDAHKTLSDNPGYRFTAFIEVTTPSGNKVRSSGVAIGPNVILVAAHGIPSPTNQSVITRVSMGSNVYGAEAKDFRIRSWQRYPGYVSGDFNTLDFGLIYLDEFITGFTPVIFSAATVGQTVTIVGYGRFAQIYDSSSQPSLGDRLAGYAPVSTLVSGQWPAALYFSTFLGAGSPAGSLIAMGIPGDSGGPYFNATGEIVGIHTGQSNGFDGGFGTAMRTNNPDFLNYVNPMIAASWAEYYAQRQPELREVSILAPEDGQPPMFSGSVTNGPPLGIARLQASLDLGLTDPWVNLVSTTLDAQGSASFTNVPDLRPHALGVRSNYFRVVTEAPSFP